MEGACPGLLLHPLPSLRWVWKGCRVGEVIYQLPWKGGSWAFPVAEPQLLPTHSLQTTSLDLRGWGQRRAFLDLNMSSETLQVGAGPWHHLEESWRPAPAHAAGELAVSDLSLTACLVPLSSISD